MTTTRTTYTIDVPGTLTTVNATRRRHWSQDAAETKQWRSDGFHVAKAAKIPRLDKVTIIATPQQARGRLADAGAASHIVKAVVDSLVDAGVIVGDGPDVVVALNQCAPVRVDARDEGLRIVITEVTNESETQ